MAKPQFCFPPEAHSARTFAELLRAYLSLWQPGMLPSVDIDGLAGDLMSQAIGTAARFPEVPLWDILEPVLRDTVRAYKASKKSTLDKLFRRNLAKRFRRVKKENVDKATAKAVRLREDVATDLRRRQADEGADARHRWYAYLLAQAYPRLDAQTRTYIDMKRELRTAEDIAEALGLTVAVVKNKYAGKKIGRLVGQAVREVVRNLPEVHRQLLVHHLMVETDMTLERTRELLGVQVTFSDAVPVIREGPLLALLGWANERQEES